MTRPGRRRALLLAAMALVAAIVGPPTPVSAVGTVIGFADGFENGTFSRWSEVRTAGSSRASVVAGGARSGAFAARLTTSSTSGSLARMDRTLAAATDLAVSADLRVAAEGSAGTNAWLLRLRAPDGTYLASLARTAGNGRLVVAWTGRTVATNGRLPLGRWAGVGLRVVPRSRGAVVEVRLDGRLVFSTRTATMPRATAGMFVVGGSTGRRLSLSVDRVKAVMPPPTGGSPSPTPVPTGQVRFTGRGTDHGVGLSQWGAHGRALAGQDAAGILAHYYRGTSLGATDPERPVRVQVVDPVQPSAAHPARVVARGGRFTVDGLAESFPADGSAALVRTGTGGWGLEVRDALGVVLATSGTSDARVRPADPATRLELDLRASSNDLYRGTIRLIASGTTVRAVNELGLDEYLRGVVPAEMPASWPAAALHAQAIVARSYAVRKLVSTGTFDLYDDTRHQVYLGLRGERSATDVAVSATAGQVVMAAGAVANTLYHSTGGGATEHNENVFTASDGRIVAGPLPYLRGEPDVDPSGRPYDAASPSATWQTDAYTWTALSTIFGADPRTAVGDLRTIDLSRRGVSGRLIAVTLVGTSGTKTVSGAVFKATFNAARPAGSPPMRSTLVEMVPVP